MSVLESTKSYGSGYKFGVAKGVVEDLRGLIEFKDDDFSERSFLCLLFQDLLAGFVLSICILVANIIACCNGPGEVWLDDLNFL